MSPQKSSSSASFFLSLFPFSFLVSFSSSTSFFLLFPETFIFWLVITESHILQCQRSLREYLIHIFTFGKSMCQKGNHVPSIAFLCPQENFQVPQSPSNMHGLDPAHCISRLSTSATTMSPHRPSGPASEPLHRHCSLRAQSFTYRHTGLLHHSIYLFFRFQLKRSSLNNHSILFISFLAFITTCNYVCIWVFSCLIFLCLLESKFSKDPDLSSLLLSTLPPIISSVPLTVPGVW